VAPEHLEINVTNYKKYISHIINAGSICIGKYTPMAVTDYNSAKSTYSSNFRKFKIFFWSKCK